MKLPQLFKGTLIKRYKRFLVNIKLDNHEIITAHCPNSGSLIGLNTMGMKVYVSKNTNPKNKLDYKLELIEDANQALVDINTSRTNHLVAEALHNQQIPELSIYPNIASEVTCLNSRFDFKLSDKDKICWLEVKSVTLNRLFELAEFPDAVTARGTKHLQDLTTIKNNDVRAVNLYLIQRNNKINSFQIAKDIDIKYHDTFNKAKECGVEFLCYNCNVSTQFINLNHKVPINYDYIK